MTTRSGWTAAVRRWPFVVAMGVVGIIVAALVLSGQTTRYEGQAEVLLQPSTATSPLSARTVESYAHVLGSATLERRAVKALKLDSVPDTDVRGEVVGDSAVIRVVVRSPQPDRAARLAGRIATEFTSWLTNVQKQDAAPRRSGTDDAAQSDGTDQTDGTGQTGDTGQTARSEASATTTPVVIDTVVVQDGTASDRAVEPERLRTYALGALVGLLVGVAIAFLRNLAAATVTSSDALKEQLQVPVIGAIAQDRHVVEAPLITSLSSQHPRAEAMRIIRTNLQFLDIDRTSNVYVVTSCVAGEGKTTTASNLAISLAQSGQNVVLVDGDLRRPRLHEVFGVEKNVGLTSVLVGRAPLDAAVQGTDVPGLDVLTSGTRPPNPSEIIQTAAMESVLLELGRRYDVVLVDAPPVLPVADAALLSVIADGAILVVRHGRTGHDQVRAAAERVSTVGGRLLGAIISMAPKKETARYGYGYGYDDVSGKGRRRR